MSPLLLFHLLLLVARSDLALSITTADYLKLRLVHRHPPLTAAEALASDTLRLKSPIISGASTGSGQYFVDFIVGTPPQRLLLVVDTGSDLVWVKCSACRRNCSLLHPPGSAFLPRHSLSFSPLHCSDPACRLVPHPPNRLRHRDNSRCDRRSSCSYEYSYTDQSTTSGLFSIETATLNASSGREVKLRRVHFGCGFHISGQAASGDTFDGAHGVMGLGRGPISFASQLGRRVGNKFSYCLMDYTLSPPPTSFLLIGEAHGPGPKAKPKTKPMMSFTPLLTNPLSPTFYYVGIKSVFVDGVKLPVKRSVWGVDGNGNGGTVIDSGTTLSFFATPAYREMLTAFKRRVRLPLVSDPALGFDLCVNVSGRASLGLPRMSFRLVGGSVFSPPSSNYFIDVADGVKCLALQPVSPPSSFSVIGNLMQQGFLFEFDRDKSRLGFTRHGCAGR